eukprot:TRINITY_DN14490_c0_g2_i1.p1 TRINITY_DN14490_c0_g2~~TRINITY_DN14490_c0_g2_i1.p1  ORF type:complete len:358 (+),score=91.97 TRINITY_DN14490_c0_g2_i1:45-1076(+)
MTEGQVKENSLKMNQENLLKSSTEDLMLEMQRMEALEDPERKLSTDNLSELIESDGKEEYAIELNEKKIMQEVEKNTPKLTRNASRSLVLMNTIMDEILDLEEEPEGKKVINRWHSVVMQHNMLTDRRLSSSGHRVTPTPKVNEKKKLEQLKVKKLYDTYVTKGDPNELYSLNSKSIAKGSLGEVFFATTRNKSTPVAIKKLQLIRNGRDRLPFILREIDIIATSAHPNIVQYIQSFEHANELWVIMEYMSFGSLYEIVKLHSRGVKLKEPACAYVLREVLLAVSFLHSRKRIHRDIKVDNILLSKSGSVKLADFGTAVQLTFQRLRRNTIAGTPYYMAPELI